MADVLARFLLRSGTSTLWASVNPILASGEPGFETDTKIMRIGDGVTAYTSLPKIVSALAVGQAILAAADATAAQTAMGGTSVGRGVFSAADAAAAQTAIGASTTGKAVLVAADQAAARTAIGAVIGTHVQAYDADLVALAGIAGVEGDLIYRNASQWTKLAKGAAGRVLTQNAGLTAPEWAIPKSIDLLGTLNATSGSAQTLSGLNLTEYKLLFIAWLNVSGTGAANLVYKTLTLSALGGGTSAHSGHMWIDLSLGVAVSHSVNFSASPQAVSVTPLAIVGATVNADTSVSFSLSAGTFDSGTFEIYGVK